MFVAMILRYGMNNEENKKITTPYLNPNGYMYICTTFGSKKINKSYESRSRYYINHIIYCVIFSKFEYMACDNTIDYMKSFLTNINLLFKFNVLPNTNKKLNP